MILKFLRVLFHSKLSLKVMNLGFKTVNFLNSTHVRIRLMVNLSNLIEVLKLGAIQIVQDTL